MTIDYNSKNDFNNPVELLDYANQLFLEKDYRTLEKVFGKKLKKSYNLDFWLLYVNYVKKVSQKKFDLHEVYEFVLDQFEHYWNSYDIYKAYIEELSKIEDDQTRIGKTRNAYMRALQTPMNNLSEIWKDFENFELDLNKITGKKIVLDALPIFQASFQQYQVIYPLIKAWTVENVGKMIDIELSNPLKLNTKMHLSRMKFIYNFALDTFYYVEEIYFFYVEFLISNKQKQIAKEVLQRGMDACRGPFLSLYCAYTMDDETQYQKLIKNYENEIEFFRSKLKEEDEIREDRMLLHQYKLLELVLINYLNYTLKKRGLEAFRELFIELSKSNIIGPSVFIYCANVEYYATKNKTAAYNIFSTGLLKNPDSVYLKEEFFIFLLKIGDEENARALFKRLGKTNRMWDAMIEYEFMVGSMELFRELTEERMNDAKQGNLLESLPKPKEKKRADGILGKYYCFLNSLCFINVDIENTNPLNSFIKNLPTINEDKNVLSNISIDKLIDFIRELNI